MATTQHTTAERFPVDAGHLRDAHSISFEAIPTADALTDALCEFEDAGCRRCSELLDSFLARDNDQPVCDDCRSQGPHCPEHGKYRS